MLVKKKFSQLPKSRDSGSKSTLRALFILADMGKPFGFKNQILYE
jgi:hypothetical protein